jgi:hypothetical protein
VSTINLRELSAALNRKCETERLTLLDVERQTQVSRSTLWRVRTGSTELTLDHFILLMKWLRLPVERVAPSLAVPGVVSIRQDEPLPDVVAALIRADPVLTEAQKQIMENVFYALHAAVLKGA